MCWLVSVKRGTLPTCSVSVMCRCIMYGTTSYFLGLNGCRSSVKFRNYFGFLFAGKVVLFLYHAPFVTVGA